MKRILVVSALLISSTGFAMGRGHAECYSSNPSSTWEGSYTYAAPGYLFDCKTKDAEEVATLGRMKSLAEKCALELCQLDGAKDCVISEPAYLNQTWTRDKRSLRVCVAKATAYSATKASE